jgi:ubiquinone biosynthesis protein Coq4
MAALRRRLTPHIWRNLAMGSFKYINGIASRENLTRFLELVDLAAGAGKDVNNVFDLSDRFNGSRPMARCLEALRANPASARMLDERYVGPLYDLPAMLRMPRYSLGWTYGQVMNAMGYDPQFYRRPDSFADDAEYVNFRVYKTHDIHHILTGFSLDDLGEIGVISVSSAQFGFPAFVFLGLLGMLMNFFSSEQLYREDLPATEIGKTLGYTYSLISKGIEMGQAARPLFPIKWEEGLERPLAEWRRELNIHPVTEGVFSWYSRPNLAAAVA